MILENRPPQASRNLWTAPNLYHFNLFSQMKQVMPCEVKVKQLLVMDAESDDIKDTSFQNVSRINFSLRDRPLIT